MASVTPFDAIRLSETTALFEGGDQIGISSFITEYPRGKGPDLHLHPYPEAFVVLGGTAVFTAGEEELTVSGGNVVVVPARTPHGFKNPADETLRVVSIHPSSTVEQTNL